MNNQINTNVNFNYGNNGVMPPVYSGVDSAHHVRQRGHGTGLQQGLWGGQRLNPLLAQLLTLILQLLTQIANKPPVNQDYRSVDGSGNNQANPGWGSTNTSLQRLGPKDASREPGGATEVTLPSARAVSNAVSAQNGHATNSKGLSDLFWVWGQFLDHDVTLTPAESGQSANISVPAGDRFFDPAGTGTATIGLTRSNTTLDANGQPQQLNHITSYIDGSNVYGSDKATADALRAFTGGKMLTSNGNLLPQDARGSFQAGDVRSNENPALTSMHTLWVREHNRIADDLAAQHPGWPDETLYQEARKQVVAELQAITYNEFLPNLLGQNTLGDYAGYDPQRNASISNEFATAAFRFGHTMLSPTLLRLDENGQTIPAGNLALRDAFFQPQRVVEAGIDPILRGAASQAAQAFDPMVVDDVRNFLFGQPGMGGFDLAALNIQRGRDHGLPGLNDVRESLGLARITSFNDPIWQGDFGQKLAQVYRSPDEVDLWVGGLAEKPVGDSLAGQTLTSILGRQFAALRDGDRYWYQNQFSGNQLQALERLTLADVIRRNTGVVNIQDHAMVASNIHRTTPALGMGSSAAQGASPTPMNNQQIQDLQNALSRGYLG